MARFRLELGPSRCTTRSTLTCVRRSTTARGGPAIACRPSASWPRHYGCSLITVRRALASWSTRAASSARAAAAPSSSGLASSATSRAGPSFTDEMQAARSRPRDAPDLGAAGVRQRRGRPRPSAWSPARRRSTSSDSAWPAGEPFLLEQVHLPAERFPGLLASDLEHGSLYELLGDALRHASRAGP